MIEIAPDFAAFRTAYDAGQPQVAHLRLVDDLETPVSAYLKIGHGRPYAFLFESVEGGAWRGRYSIVAMKPDLVWRCRADKAEMVAALREIKMSTQSEIPDSIAANKASEIACALLAKHGERK